MPERIRQLFTRRKYLRHMTATYVLLMLIPCCVILLLLFNRSYGQLIDTHEKSGKETLRRFSAVLQSELSSMRKSACQFALATQDTHEAVFLLGSVSPSSNNYYYAECIRLLNAYTSISGWNMAVYYRGDDVIIDKSFRYNQETYINYLYGRLMPEQDAEARAFLSQSSDPNGSFFSDGGTMLIGYPVQLGVNRRDAMVLFKLTGADIQTPILRFDDTVADYAVFDERGSLLLSTKTEGKPDAPPAEEGLKRMKSGYTAQYKIQDDDGLICVLSLKLDSATSGLIVFFIQIRALVSAAVAILLLLTVLVIYLNYRPVGQIMHQVVDSQTGDEFGDLSRYISRLNSEMSEQNLRLMDYLMNNLLNGMPVPIDELERASLMCHAGYFAVMTLFSQSVNTQMRLDLAAMLQEKYRVKVFITDILGRDQVVFIMLLESPEIQPLEDCVREWLQERMAEPIILTAGTTVTAINGISESYQASLCERTEECARTEEGNPPQVLILRDGILKYLNEHYTDPNLSQIAVADIFGISTYSLSRLFKKHVGIGFSEYVTGRRLELAKQLLMNTQKSVAEIACDVGISSANYFSRLFKTNVGVSPIRYREGERI
ncbi:MAG: helix-turn-helix transcriptional regulator [Christensenellales bacterium]